MVLIHFAHSGMGNIRTHLKLAIKFRNSVPNFLCVLLYRPNHVGLLLHQQCLCLARCGTHAGAGVGGFGEGHYRFNNFLISFNFIKASTGVKVSMLVLRMSSLICKSNGSSN